MSDVAATSTIDQPTVLVISAHGADFVWRCGGTMARYAQEGSKVHVVCLTLGQRGESEGLWHQGIRSEEEIVALRTKESVEAAARLGATVDVLAMDDHPFTFDRSTIERLAGIMQTVRPHIILTHHATDVNNPDHEVAHQLTRWSVRAASVQGAVPEIPALDFSPHILSFESDQSSLDRFLPNVYVDISDVVDTKRHAMEAIASQSAEMIDRYLARAAFRASLMRNIPGAAFAEGFVRLHAFEGRRIPM